MLKPLVAAISMLGVISAETSAVDDRLLTVGVTGSANGAGPENPFYLLNNPALARLALEAADGPVSSERVSAALEEADIGASIDNLLETGVLRADAGQYVINFVLFTA